MLPAEGGQNFPNIYDPPPQNYANKNGDLKQLHARTPKILGTTEQ